MNLLRFLPLLTLVCLGAELKFNIILSDEELIQADVMKAKNKQIPFQWGYSTVSLELWSDEGSLEPTICAQSSCQLQNGTISDNFKNKTIPDLQRLLQRTTLSLSVQSDEAKVQLLMLLKWHEPEIVDYVDYGTTLTIYAKQISVGIEFPQQVTTTQDVKDAVVVPSKSVLQLQGQRDCNLKLLSVVEGKAYLDVQGTNRNGTCTFTDIDYQGPAMLGNTNILFEELPLVKTCSSRITQENQYTSTTYDARLLENSEQCTSLKHENIEFPAVWFEKPSLTECVSGDVHSCKFTFREIQSDKKTLMHGDKPVSLPSKATPLWITNEAFIIEASNTQITVTLSAVVNGNLVCEIISIDGAQRSYSRIAKSADRDQVTCDLSGLELKGDYAIKVVGDDFITSSVMVSVVDMDQQEDHFVVYQSLEEFYPKKVNLRFSVAFRFTGQCVFTNGTIIEVISDLAQIDTKSIECSIDSRLFKTGATSYNIMISLKDGQRISRSSKLWLQPAVTLQQENGILTRVKTPQVWRELFDQFQLQDINTMELISPFEASNDWIDFDTCSTSKDVKLVVIISGEIISLSTNVIKTEPCQLADTKPSISYDEPPQTGKFIEDDRLAIPLIPQKDINLDVLQPPDPPQIVLKSEPIKLLPISFESSSMKTIRTSACINHLSLSVDSIDALILLNIETKVLCTIQSSRAGKPTGIYQSTLRQLNCDSICVSIKPQDEVDFYLFADQQLTERIQMQLVQDIVIESVEPYNIILVSGLEDTSHALKFRGHFPDTADLFLVLSNNYGEYLRLKVKAPITTVLVSQRDLKPGVTNLYIAQTSITDHRSNQVQIFVQDSINFETWSEQIFVLSKRDEPVKIPFIKMDQLASFLCYYKTLGQTISRPATHENGVYNCVIPQLIGEWTVSVGVDAQNTDKQIATVNSLSLEVKDFSPTLILFSTQEIVISLKYPIKAGDLFCKFTEESTKTRVKFIDNLQMVCDVPKTSSLGLKSLQITTGFSSLTLSQQIQVAHFENPVSISSIPSILETQMTDQFIIIDFEMTFDDLDLVVQYGQTRERAQLIGTTYHAKLLKLQDGLLQFEFLLCQPSKDPRSAVSLGLSIVKQVVPSPSVTLYNAIHLFQSDQTSQISIIGESLFIELELVCLFDEGLIRSTARVIGQQIICDFKPAQEGKHHLEVFSNGLNRFISRSGYVVVEQRPQIMNASQLVLFNQDGDVLQPVIIELDVGIFRKIDLELRSHEGDTFWCPCQGKFRTLSCECGKAPLYSVYEIGIRVYDQLIPYDNQLRFSKVPLIIDSVPRVVGPLTELQFITIMLDDDGLELVEGILWNNSNIASKDLIWITSKKLQVPVRTTQAERLIFQLQIMGGFISEPFIIPVSDSFSVSALQVGSIPDESCLFSEGCIFNMRQSTGVKVLQRHSMVTTVISIKGSFYKSAINCLLKTDSHLVSSVRVYMISDDTLICVVPQLNIDQLAPSSFLSVGIGLQDSDLSVFLTDNIVIIDMPQLSRILPQRIYGSIEDGAIISSPITLTVTGLWTPNAAKMMVKIGNYHFIATPDKFNAATIMYVELGAISLPIEPSQSQANICVRISADDGQSFSENQSITNAPCQLVIMQKPDFQSIEFTPDTQRLKSVISYVPFNFSLAWRFIDGEWSSITKYDYKKTQTTTLEIEFISPALDNPIEFGISTIEGQYIVCPLLLAPLWQHKAEPPRNQVLVQREDLDLVSRASLLDFNGSVTSQVVVAATSNLASFVQIKIYNSSAQLEAIQKLLSQSMDFVFSADGVSISRDFSFMQVGSQVYLELQITPTLRAIGQKPNLFVQAAAVVGKIVRLMSSRIETGVQLDFTEALVVRPVPTLVVFGSDIGLVHEVVIEGTGLQFLDGSQCKGESASGVVVVKDGQAKCLFKMTASQDTSLKFMPPFLLDRQNQPLEEALPEYNIRVFSQAPSIKSVEKQGSLLKIKVDFQITDIASQISCVFFGYNPTEQLWHQLFYIQANPKPTHIECPIPSQLTKACQDNSLRLDFLLRQGTIKTPRYQLPSSLKLGSAYQQLKVKSIKQRLIRGDFAQGDISRQVGFLQVELESQPCLAYPIPALECVYSAQAQSLTVLGKLDWPLVSCPVVYLGQSSEDLMLQFHGLESSQSLQIKEVIKFDQGQLKIMTFGPMKKLASKKTTFLFQLTETYESLECQFVTKNQTIRAQAVVTNRIVKCECPPIRDHQVSVMLKADQEMVPFADSEQAFERTVQVIHDETFVLVKNEFQRIGQQKVILRGQLLAFEFCVFMEKMGGKQYYSELVKERASIWECEIPKELSPKLQGAFQLIFTNALPETRMHAVSFIFDTQQPIQSPEYQTYRFLALQPFDSEELTDGIPISFSDQLQISHAFYDESGTLSFGLTGNPESISCLLQTNAGGITVPARLKDGIYQCQQLTNLLYAASQFQVVYFLPGDNKPYTSAFITISHDLEKTLQSYTFMKSQLGMNLFKARRHNPPEAVCKYFVSGVYHLSQLRDASTIPDIWVNKFDLNADMIFVCEQIASTGQLIDIQTATLLLTFESDLTQAVQVEFHKKQISSLGHLRVFIKTEFDGMCSLRGCLLQNVYSKLTPNDNKTKLCEIQNPCIEPSDTQIMVSQQGLMWHGIKVPVQIKSDHPKVLTWWPTVIDGSSEQTYALYGSDFRNDLTLRIQGQVIDFLLVSTREISFSANLDAAQYAPDERVCKAEEQQSCIGPYFDVAYEFLHTNPVLGHEQIVTRGNIQLRIKHNHVIRMPSLSPTIPAFTVQPTIAICGVKTQIRLNFESSVSSQLRFKNQLVVMETDRQGEIEFYESCKSSNLTSTYIRFGDKTALLSITKQFQLTILQDALLTPINDADFFRVLVQSMKNRLTCIVGQVKGTLELLEAKDIYKCKIEAAILSQQMKILVDEVTVAISTGHDNQVLTVFDQAVLQIDRTEYTLGVNQALEAKLYLIEKQDLSSASYTCSYESLLDQFSMTIPMKWQGDKLSCDLPDRDKTYSYEVQITARIGLDSKILHKKQILIKARPTIVMHPQAIFEGSSLQLKISYAIMDIALACFAQQGSQRLRRAPATKLNDDTYICDIKLSYGFNQVYLGVDSTPFTQNKVEVKMMRKPLISAVMPNQVYNGPSSSKTMNLRLEGEYSSLMDNTLSLSINLLSRQNQSEITIDDINWNVNNQDTFLQMVIPDMHQVPPGKHELVIIGTISDIREEIARIPFEVIQHMQFEFYPKIICTRPHMSPVLLNFDFTDIQASHCMLISDDKTSTIKLINACQVQPPFKSVALGKFNETQFIQMTETKAIIYRGPVTIHKAYIASKKITIEGFGFMLAFDPKIFVYCEVQSRPNQQLIAGKSTTEETTRYQLIAFIVNDQDAECDVPQSMMPNTYNLSLMTSLEGHLYLRTNQVQFQVGFSMKTKAISMKWEVWTSQDIRHNALLSDISRAQAAASSMPTLLVIMTPSQVVFDFHLTSDVLSSIQCRILRLSDNQIYQEDIQDKHIPTFSNQVSCQPVMIGPQAEFFKGTTNYQILVSFDGIDYEALTDPITISVRMPVKPTPITIKPDVHKEHTQSYGAIALSQSDSNCPVIRQESESWTHEWVYYSGSLLPILVLDQTEQRFNTTSSYHKERTVCQVLVPKKDTLSSQSLPVMGGKVIQEEKAAKLTLYVDKDEGYCSFEYYVPQVIQPFKYTTFKNGNKTDDVIVSNLIFRKTIIKWQKAIQNNQKTDEQYLDAYAFYTLPSNPLSCEPLKSIILPPTFKLYKKQPIIIHQSTSPLYIFEDQTTLSDQSVQKDLLSVTLIGQNFTPDMTCLLTSKSGQVYEEPIQYFEGPGLVRCSIASIVEEQFKQETTAWIRLKDNIGLSLLKGLDGGVTNDALQIVFKPRLTISLREGGEMYYLGNLDQTVELSLSLSPISAQCEFKSIYYTTRTLLSQSHECPIPQLSNEDSQTIELSVRQYHPVLSPSGPIVQYSLSNKLHLNFQRLQKITSILPLEVPALSDFYNQIVNVYGTDLKQGCYIVLRPLEGRDYFQMRESSYQRQKLPRIDSQWIVIRDFTVHSKSHGTFYAPKNMPVGTYSVQVATDESISDDQIAINFIKLPEIRRLIPDSVPQIAVTDILGADQGHQIVVEGRNFTHLSACVVQSFIISGGLEPVPKDTLVPTVWISPEHLQCTIIPQEFAPFSYSGNTVKIRVLERSLYLNAETWFDLQFINQPYVWKVEPNQAYLGHPNTTIRVFVSNLIVYSDLDEQFLFCNFGDSGISKVTKVEKVQGAESDCSGPDFYNSGRSSHLLLRDECRTQMIIFHCMTPSTRRRNGLSTKVEILNSQGKFTHTVLGNNAFQFLAAPVMHAVHPQVLPIVDLHLQPIAGMALLTITGEYFNSQVQYQCIFKKNNFSQNSFYLATATVVSTSKLTCNLPYIDGYPIGLEDSAFITIELQTYLPQQATNLVIKGMGSIKLFKQPVISNYWPKIGQQSGDTLVTISGINLDPSLGGILCRFGTIQVEATVFTISKMIQCRSPQSSTVGSAVLSVSVDGGLTFFNMFSLDSKITQAIFVYLPNSLVISGIQNKSQDYWGRLDIGINTNLPYTDLLELAKRFGLPQVEVKCRFDFTNTDRIETVGTIAQNSIICPTDRHLVDDNGIKMAVSFNNQEFIVIAYDIQLYSELIQYESIPLTTVAYQDLYSHIVNLQNTQEKCPNIYQQPSQPFHVTISPLWANDLNIFVSIDSTIQTIPCKTREEFQMSFTELTPKAISKGYEYEFTVDSLLFRFFYKDNSEPVTSIYEKLYGLYSWLCSQSSAIMLCQSQTKEFMISIKPYYDPSTPKSTIDTRLSCKVGSYNFSQYSVKDQVMQVECMINLANYIPVPFPIQVNYAFDSLTPKFAFIDELNVTLTLVVRPLFDIDSLRCKVNDVPLMGTYAVINQTPSVQCVVPSLTYLKALSEQVPSDGVWSVSVSLDGITYSSQAYSFKFIESEQIKALSVMNGPETGGTIITLQVRDLAPVDEDDLPKVMFKFPGHDTDNSQVVDGVYIGLNTITCKVPPLKAQAMNTDVTVHQKMFTTVRVQLEILGYRIKEYFTFTYLKGVSIKNFDPPNYVFDKTLDAQSQPIYAPSSRTVKIIGQHFIPVEDQLYCRIGFTQPVSIQAQYRFNNTVECNIPPPPLGTELPLAVPIELSFNQGQQYTISNVKFHYTPKDQATKIYPTRQYVKGNKLVKVFTSYFFDKAAPTAKCKFTYDAIEYVTDVVRYDAQGVMCYHPPAYLISPVLAEQGGQTLVTVSSNGIDYSTNSPQVFTYKKAVVITKVHPPFVLMDQQVVVSLTGENFYSVADTNLLKLRLKRIVTNPYMTPLSYIVSPPNTQFVDSNLVTFVFPSGVFNDKDFVDIELTFDEITWDSAYRSRVVVYKQIVLTKIRPAYVYTSSTNNEIILQAQPFLNEQGILQKGGSIWEMEQFGWLKCRFNSQLNPVLDQSTEGRFFNATHVGCPLPVYAVPEKIMVDLTIDNGITYSANKVGVYLINEPQILSLNNTEYFYTFNERVFIELTGTNFDQSNKLYVRVGEQVQIIPTVQFSGQTVFVFEMPQQLNVGSQRISVSTDGQTYRPRPTDPTQFIVTVEKCPNGYICSQEEKTICPQGFFCPHDQLQVYQKRECPLGTYMTDEGASECIPCSAGKFCPNIGLIVEQACPIGFICNKKSQYSVTQLMECPAGYICKPDVTQTLDKENLFASQNMKPCPPGYFCPKGTIEQQVTSFYGNFTTPQLCRDGVVCAQNVEERQTINQPGALNQFGTEICPVGFYCQKGRKTRCPKGFQCPDIGAYQPKECPPGYFQQNTTQTSCEQCPIGTFCFFSQMQMPIKCTPGWVCHYQAEVSPYQLCPAGSFCNLATVTNQTNSTVEALYKPNFCYQSSYCLAGVSTPFVNQSDQQAAQSCIAGTFCAEGSASPEGKGKCKEGFYCPANSIEMIPTEPGYFAQGTGNVAPEKCRPGTYQSMPQQADCIECPVGFFCPEQMMTEPQICGAGEFSMIEGSTQCSKCPLGTFSDQVGVSNEESCFLCEPRFLCTSTGLTTMKESQACIEGFYCSYGTTNTIMLNSKVSMGYYGGYNITGLAEFNLCLEGKYCPAGTAFSKVKQLDCLRGFFCPIGTMADLDLDGNFKPGVKQVNRNILINALRGYLAESIKYTEAFRKNITDNRLDNLLNFYRANQQKYIAEYNRLDWEFYKYNLNLTIIQERQKYMDEVLLTDIRCEEDQTLPEHLIQDYIKNGTNLVCPKGTESDRGSWCLGQCKINLVSKEPMSILNPVNDIYGITSLSQNDLPMSSKFEELGSKFRRENPEWDNENAKRDKDSLFGQSPFAKGSKMNPFRQLNQSDSELTSHDRHRLLRQEQINIASRQTQRNLQLNSQNRNYDILGGGVFDTIHVQTLKPLEIARLNFNLTVLPDKMLYNDHFEIKIFDQDDVPYKLPVYFSVENNKVTNKRALLQIRIFNWTEKDQVFKVGLYVYHALFIPYLEILSDKMWVEVYNAERQTRGSNFTHGVIITEQQFEGVTLPYNTPDYQNDPSLFLDFVSTNQPDAQGRQIPEEFRVNPTTKGLDKDIFDPTYWQSKQINAVIMPWLPFFSNCDGFDSRIIIYDAFEYAKNCTLEDYDKIRIVNPLPLNGLYPTADSCTLDITCRYDEQLDVSNSFSTRWFQIQEEKTLGYITRAPIPIENFWKIEDSDVYQTFYNSLIEDGSDDVIFINFVPTDTTGERIPRLVEVYVNYYQQTTDIKLIQSVQVLLKEYDEPLQEGQIPEVGYRLKIYYKPLNYLLLINTFQFPFPIYILLFNLVALILILTVLTFWLFVLLFTRVRKPPVLRFKHLAKIIFTAPAVGTFLSCLPVIISALVIILYTRSKLFHNLNSNWINMGVTVSNREIIQQQRGRAGLMLVVVGFIFLHYGSQNIIYKPSEEEEEEILAHKHKLRKLERIDLSMDDQIQAQQEDDEKEKKEENQNIRNALDWKRRHFFVVCIFVLCFLMLKIEFSYTKTFSKNITYFLTANMALDIISEQVLVRLIMSEALLVAPMMGSFVVCEFIMTMGAQDFRSFIISYFISFSVTAIDRIFIGPFVEKLEAWTQRMIIHLATRSNFIKRIFQATLVRQLGAQLQLMSLNEYNDRKIRNEDKKEVLKKRKFYDWQLEKGEGAEALIGTMMTYTTQTQALFLIPETLLLIIFLANETKIPLKYTIRKSDLTYYFIFTAVIILPNLIIDIFVLHIIEIIQGYKIFDYFTYCDYRYNVRTKKWLSGRRMDKSLNHQMRSLDSLMFSSQYYYTINLTTWSILFMYLGVTTVNRNLYNPFADPILVPLMVCFGFVAVPLKWLLAFISDKAKLWAPKKDDSQRIDVSLFNRLDAANNQRRIINNIQTNPFRHKFIMVNREWLVSNIADVLGGRTYHAEAGAEMDYLKHIYQTAINTQKLTKQMEVQQKALAKKLEMMPYNQKKTTQDVSDDRISDQPFNDWDIPLTLAQPYVLRLARMWIDFARQQIRLKFMVADIVQSKLKNRCQKCKERFRLQVIQKFNFTTLTRKFMEANVGIPFSQPRWRRFFARRQLFTTLCMECAYIDNLQAGALREENPKLQQFLEEHAYRLLNQNEELVRKKLKQPHIRRLIYKWLQMSRASLLHKERKQVKEDQQISKTDSTLDYF